MLRHEDVSRRIAKQPSRPSSGRFMGRVSSEPHRMAETDARAGGQGLNAVIAQAPERAVSPAGVPPSGRSPS